MEPICQVTRHMQEQIMSTITVSLILCCCGTQHFNKSIVGLDNDKEMIQATEKKQQTIDPELLDKEKNRYKENCIELEEIPSPNRLLGTCLYGEEKWHQEIDNVNRALKKLYVKKCTTANAVRQFMETQLSDHILYSVELTQNVDQIEAVFENLETDRILIDLSNVYLVTRTVEILQKIPKNIVALRIVGWDSNTTQEEQKQISDALSGFGKLKYLELDIYNGDLEFSRNMTALKCLNAKIENVDPSKIASYFSVNSGIGLEHIKLHWKNHKSVANWLKEMPTLKTIELTQFGSSVSLSDLPQLEKLEKLWVDMTNGDLPGPKSWPHMKELIVWKSDISNKKRQEFQQKRNTKHILILNNADKIDYLFGKASEIVFRRVISADEETDLIKVISDKGKLNELYGLLDAEPKVEDLSLMCRGDVTAHITTQNGNKEVVDIFDYGSILKWKGWGDLVLKKASQKKLEYWLIENGIVSDGSC